jgi:tetratricopeptide (TPR) repeat protein
MTHMNYLRSQFHRKVFRALGLLAALVLCWGRPAFAQRANPENLPMYGQPDVVRSDELKKADEDFIRDAILRFGGREAASRAYVTQGWQAVRNHKGDEAMQRFNQAWLLNRKNYQAYWGFGAVLSDRGKLGEAIEQLNTARELMDDPSQATPLLSDLGAVHSEYAAHLPPSDQLERARHFNLANQAFAASLERNPNYAPGWREWAISLYKQERYADAATKAQRAKELNAEPFPPEFLNDLQQKTSESK